MGTVRHERGGGEPAGSRPARQDRLRDEPAGSRPVRQDRLRGEPAVAGPRARQGRPLPRRAGRRRRPGRWVLALVAVLIVAVAAGAAAGVAQLLDPRYGARAELVYDLGGAEFQEADRLLATQVVVIASRAVLAPVAEEHELAPRDLARQVEAELLEDSQVVEVTASAPDPETALALVAAVTDAYLDVAADLDALDDVGVGVLTPPYALEEPLGPGPLQALAAGTIAGILLAAATVLGLLRLGRERA